MTHIPNVEQLMNVIRSYSVLSHYSEHNNCISFHVKELYLISCERSPLSQFAFIKLSQICDFFHFPSLLFKFSTLSCWKGVSHHYYYLTSFKGLLFSNLLCVENQRCKWLERLLKIRVNRLSAGTLESIWTQIFGSKIYSFATTPEGCRENVDHM